jgi:hypothetical protein
VRQSSTVLHFAIGWARWLLSTNYKNEYLLVVLATVVQ